MKRSELRQLIREMINEAISADERAKYVEFAKELKKRLQNHLKLKITSRVLKSQRPNPWIEIGIKNWKTEQIPNIFRVKAAKSTGASGVLDWNDVNYGNIRSGRIALKYEDWIKFANLYGKPDGWWK